MDICIKPRTLSGEIEAISSKSDVHRILIAAALAKGTTACFFTTLSEDIQATVDVLSAMGAKIDIRESDGGYVATVCGISTMPQGVTLNANECGTTARLLLPIAAALGDAFTLTGKSGLRKRPFADLCAAMAENGSACSDTFLPISVRGRLQSGIFSIRGDVSSQYISGLLFALPLCAGDSELHITSPLVSAGYIDMTLATLAKFGIEIEKTDYGFFIQGRQIYKASGTYKAEGDWSNSAFWICAGVIGENITVSGLDTNSFQKDKDILKVLTRAGAGLRITRETIQSTRSDLLAVSFDGENMPDALPVLATVLCLAKGQSVIRGGARLKIKESDRIATTVSMLRALGASITATDDGFIINGVESLHGGVVDAANDHRIAMCAAIAAQRATDDVIIRGAECVNKSYPTFFEDFRKLGGNCCAITNG